MVNFNNETTVSVSASNLVRLLILEARYNSFLAFEDYNTKLFKGIQADQSIIRARLGSWFLEHQAYLDRIAKKEEDKIELETIKNLLFQEKKSLTYENILMILTYLNTIDDVLRLTKIDTKTQYDRTNAEADNEANEYY